MKQISEQERWMLLFKEGLQLDDGNLPVWMKTPEMLKAMEVIKGFSEDENKYRIYQARKAIHEERRAAQDSTLEPEVPLGSKVD